MKIKIQLSHIFVLFGVVAVGYLAIKHSSELADMLGGIEGHLPTSALGGPAIYSEQKQVVDTTHHGFQRSGY